MKCLKSEYNRKYYLEHKEKIKEQTKQYLNDNREKMRAAKRAYYLKNKRQSHDSAIKWAKNNKEKVSEIKKSFNNRHKDEISIYNYIKRLEIKTELVSAYGGKCTCCGENEIRFLTIEHLNRDGQKHRKAVGNVYRDLKKRGYPKDGFTILCMNCNFSERLGEPCPHKLTVNKILFGVAA